MKKLIDFSKYSSIKIGPLIEVELINSIKQSSSFIVGRASNLLISNNPPPLAVLGDEFDYIKESKDEIIVGAGVKSGKFYNYCKKNDIANYEFLSKIPGNFGGIVKMNAGLKEYEVFNYIKAIKTKDGYIEKKDIEYGYRFCNINEIIFEVILEKEKGFLKAKYDFFTSLRKNQPTTPSAGSCFKNPKNDYAGRLIEEVGLKGFEKGGVSFSNIHSNFLVNNGGGTFEDALYLIELAKERVYKKFNILLENEIEIL